MAAKTMSNFFAKSKLFSILTLKIPWQVSQSSGKVLLQTTIKCRYSSSPPFMPPPQDTAKLRKIMQKDKISPGFRIVYQNVTSQYVGYAQITSVSMSVSIVATGLYTYFSPTGFNTAAFGPQSSFQGLFASASLLATCISLQYLAYKTPLRIYKDGKKFIMIRNGLLGQLGPTRKTAFLSGEARPAPFSRATVWNDIRYKINGKTYLIYGHRFRTNADYLAMVGEK